MKKHLVDLHIHSLLSPCGSLEMSPVVIVDKAVKAGLDAIALTDHNSLRQLRETARYGATRGLKVFIGVEITTREEAHCVAILPDMDAADALQTVIDEHIIKQQNNPEKLGDQVWVDADEQIEGEIEWYLNAPLALSVDAIAREVKHLNGLFVPAHVDRPSYSLIGQLGFIDPDLPVDALEFNSLERFTKITDKGGKYLRKYSAYSASDAHFPHLIGTNPSWLYGEELSFGELRRALAQQDGRKIISKLYDSQ